MINVTWDGRLFPLTLPVAALPGDTYSWNGLTQPDANNNIFYVFGITDSTHSAGSVGLAEVPIIPTACGATNCSLNDSGTLAFSTAVVTPEPSSVALMLAGIGFLLLVTRKRIAQGHAQTA